MSFILKKSAIAVAKGNSGPGQRVNCQDVFVRAPDEAEKNVKEGVTFYPVPYKCQIKPQKQTNMKLVKLGVFALALGLFATSCSNESSTSTETKTDSAAMAPAPMETAPAAPVTTDSAAMSTTAAGTDTAVMKTETHTETKTK